MSFEKPKVGGPIEEVSGEEEPVGIGIEAEEELERESEVLKSMVGGIAERLKREHVPVTEDCRIDMTMFRGVYSPEAIQRDQEYAERIMGQGEERRRFPRRQLAGETPERLKATGERMEMLKTVVFDKFLGKDFVVVRSVRYDDVANKIDNVILDRKTGNLVCAFDEVGESSGPKYERKKDEVLRRDREKGGGTLKYGLRMERGNRLIRDKVENVPIFYLALPKELIDETIEQLDPSADEPSRREKQLFTYFATSLYSQIQLLNMDVNLNPVLADRIKNFERILEGLQEKK